MKPLPRIKICCISSVEEAQLAIAHGASALGLVSSMPSGPGVIGDALIGEIARQVPPPIATFLLTTLRDADAIIAQHAVCKTNTLQLVDQVPVGELVKLRRQLPAIKLVQVIHVLDDSSIAEALAVAPYVDALLLDSGNPTLAVKELGGTGRVHDWSISRQIRQQVDIPVFLAGGLSEANIQEAINSVQPFGLDLCSSVREDGKLSVERLARFMRAVQES
ncbi:hypothetical protein [Chitinimonas sp.]|uniref:phosphoribosylanthranilate isomerase n=1 Tax=Chitinimonas sp. TaxID=1934313 RepID=UPI0035B18787